MESMSLYFRLVNIKAHLQSAISFQEKEIFTSSCCAAYFAEQKHGLLA